MRQFKKAYFGLTLTTAVALSLTGCQAQEREHIYHEHLGYWFAAHRPQLEEIVALVSACRPGPDSVPIIYANASMNQSGFRCMVPGNSIDPLISAMQSSNFDTVHYVARDYHGEWAPAPPFNWRGTIESVEIKTTIDEPNWNSYIGEVTFSYIITPAIRLPGEGGYSERSGEGIRTWYFSEPRWFAEIEHPDRIILDHPGQGG